mmetsp:Transcript_29576/g.62732  ORF Transcript_29576/g.62732 Transcript_29576/m.62732 type:complete len:256 (+) Transcript_29576:114-881(+)|eukprot:CAMPEP_0172315248 /NCGR_PEP_ID=MMETSP1058-20130122/24604_1 /TAXON_ID=83371 /ORGANISM="Detonula confervacea, Strain CCMP 353" /LENGTH=255 /DNA_ID=CAMNT_0013029295 /DNA_START=55 /DNA_END=825 /DNA_ORIENTATION=+
MVSSQSYSDFEQDYNTHLSKVRTFLAQPTNNASPNYVANISSCEQAIQSAKQCIASMQGLAEIEGDPFKAQEAKRKLERDIGPLEDEIRGRKITNNGGGISSVFNRSNNGRGGGQITTNDENYLFGNRRSYAPPSSSMGGDADLEFGEGSLTAPLTAMEQRMQDSEHLLRETQALCAESEQVGASTLETMGRQREQIERSGGLIQQSIENTQQARQIMMEMARRALKNKICLYCFIGLLVLANGAMLVHLWRRKS